MSAVPVIETLFKPLNKDKVRALYQEQQKQAIKYLENEDMPFNECANALRKGLEIVNLAYYYFPQEFKKDYKQYRAFVEKIKLFPVASIEKESAAAKEKIDSIHQFLKREVTQPIVLYVPPSDSTHTLLVTACEQFSKTDPSYAVFYVDFSSFYSLQDETEINAKYVTILKAFYQQYEQYIKDDAALEASLIHSAIEDAALHVSDDAPPILGIALEKIGASVSSSDGRYKSFI